MCEVCTGWEKVDFIVLPFLVLAFLGAGKTVLVCGNKQLTPAVSLFPVAQELHESTGNLIKFFGCSSPTLHTEAFLDILTSRADTVDVCSLLYWNSSCYLWLSQPTPDWWGTSFIRCLILITFLNVPFSWILPTIKIMCWTWFLKPLFFLKSNEQQRTWFSKFRSLGY